MTNQERKPYNPREVFWMTAEERNAYVVSPPAGYTSKGARLLRSVTRDQRVMWTPEAGWLDEASDDDRVAVETLKELAR